jgi:hypothetical protein
VSDINVAWKRFILRIMRNFSNGFVEKKSVGIIYTRYDGLRVLFVQFAIMTRAGVYVET